MSLKLGDPVPLGGIAEIVHVISTHITGTWIVPGVHGRELSPVITAMLERGGLPPASLPAKLCEPVVLIPCGAQA